MKNVKTLNVLVIITMLAVIMLNNSCHQPEKNIVPDEATKAIEASNAIYFSSFVNNDFSIFLDRYADDACIMAPFVPQ
jgi:ketosteroid isomerase-like protein